MNPTPQFLHQVPFFSSLPAEACVQLEACTRRRDFLPQSLIVREGTSDGAAYFILSGRVAVRRRDPDSGVDFVLAELAAGQMFGEMALLTGQPEAPFAVRKAGMAVARCISLHVPLACFDMSQKCMPVMP